MIYWSGRRWQGGRGLKAQAAWHISNGSLPLGWARQLGAKQRINIVTATPSQGGRKSQTGRGLGRLATEQRESLAGCAAG